MSRKSWNRTPDPDKTKKVKNAFKRKRDNKKFSKRDFEDLIHEENYDDNFMRRST